MLTASPSKTTYLFIFCLALFISCKRRDIPIGEKIIGTWKSTQTVTQVYEENQLTDSYLFKSDQHSFSMLVFDNSGHFTSSGQYADPEADSLNITVLNPQQGNYRIADDKLFTKLAQLNKEAELKLTFHGHDELNVITQAITSLTGSKSAKYFISSTTYIRVR